MSTPLPGLADAVVHRARLSRLLDAAMNRPVTLLTAPPGWGKTAGLRSWLDHRADPGPALWLRLDRTEDVAARIAAFDRGSAAGPAVVVLDDVQCAAPDVLAALLSGVMADVVEVPGGRVRLVLASRHDGALPVPRWRLSDQLTELGCAELAFTLEETSHLLAAHAVTLPAPEIAALHTRAEGWPAGIRFAALRADAIDPLTEERHDVGRYLAAEVLGQLPDRVQNLLRRTSVLDRVSGDLADALLAGAPLAGADQASDPGQAERDLEDLSAAGGFVLALGGSPPWYRYHHQFRAALRADLRRAEPRHLRPLHERAADWLAGHDLPVPALRHAWAGGDRARLSWLGQAHWAELALSGCHVTDVEADPATPDPVPLDPDHAPELVAAYVVDRLGRGDLRAADTGLHLMRDSGQSTMGVRALRLARERLDGDLAGIDASATALIELTDQTDQADPEYARVRAVALATRAAALLGTGDLVGAEKVLATTGTTGPDDPICSRRSREGINALLLAVSGRLRGAEQASRAALGLPACEGQPRDVHAEPAYLALALVSHESNRPAEADRFFELAERSRRLTVEPESGGWATLIGTRLRAARGDLPAAFDTLSAGRAAIGGDVRLATWFAAAEAELRIARGDTATARTTLTSLLADSDDGSAADDGTAALAVLLAGALLRDGDPHAAARTLPPWSDEDDTGAVLSVRLDAGLIDVQVARALGDRRQAGQSLERVLDLAEPEGFRHPFTKDGDALRDLLADHLDSGTAHWSMVSSLVRDPPTASAADAMGSGEALTEREITVLRYLQSMLSNEEIAAKLFVSVNTVKTHVRHIYRKLEVSHRRDAVRRAREVRLL